MGTLNKKMLRNHIVQVAATGMWLVTASPLARAAETNAPTAVSAPTNAPASNLAPAVITSAVSNVAPTTISNVVTKPATEIAAKPATPLPPPGKNDYVAFKIIGDRNIFNPNRTSRSAAPVVTEKPRIVKVESFALLGTMSYAKGSVAFFDGSSSSFKKALKPADTIATYKIKEIAQNGVKLESGGKEVELRVGMQMRRQDEGEWQIGAKSDSYGSASPSATSGSSNSSRTRSSEGSAPNPPAPATGTDSGSNGGASDLLKRLMEQRAKELNK